MKIGILSDTHMPASTPVLWPEVKVAFQGVDLILHAGDLEMIGVLDMLEEIAPVLAAEGNHDQGLSKLDSRIKKKQFLDIEGYRLGMTHIIDSWDLGAKRVVQSYLGELPDIVVCGDSHFEFVRWEDDMLLINAGSATYPHNLESRLGHVVILEIESGKKPTAEIIDLSTIKA